VLDLRCGEERGQRDEHHAGFLRGQVGEQPLRAVIADEAQYARPRARLGERAGKPLDALVELAGADDAHPMWPAITLGLCA
jgi:hypothetical protein